MVTLRVPATTANLGPGFDCLGCALGLHAYFTFEEISEGLSITGCPPEYCDANNLVFRAYLAACLHGLNKSPQDMLEVATQVEGHPDNVAPAILGGLCVSLMKDNKVYALPAPVAGGVRFLALVPDFSLSTHKARAALPATIAREDGVFNVGHAALLLRALETGDRALLSAAMADKLHQPYRFPLIPGSEDIARIAREQGADGFCLSGAGPTLMCLYFDAGFPARMAAALKDMPHHWQCMELEVDREGVVVQPFCG